MPIQPWSASLAKNTKRFQRIQNTLARVVTRQCGSISISKTLKELHWLPVKWRFHFKVATTTYKLLECNEPAYLRSKISVRVPRRSLRSSTDDRRLDYHPTRINIGAREFRCVAPTMLNALPLDIRDSLSASVFKSKLRSHFFD